MPSKPIKLKDGHNLIRELARNVLTALLFNDYDRNDVDDMLGYIKEKSPLCERQKGVLDALNENQLIITIIKDQSGKQNIIVFVKNNK